MRLARAALPALQLLRGVAAVLVASGHVMTEALRLPGSDVLHVQPPTAK